MIPIINSIDQLACLMDDTLFSVRCEMDVYRERSFVYQWGLCCGIAARLVWCSSANMCRVGVYCIVAVTRATMTDKRPSVLLIVALPCEGESFVVVVP